MSLEEAHTLLLYLLKQVNYISEETNIPYFAHAGTLIGALRHKGFIPWDDDIDLMIERKNYTAFVEACKRLLPDQVLVQTREDDPFFCEEYIKICFRDDVLHYSDLAVDVFVLDETDPNRKLFRAFQNKLIRMVRPIKLYKATRMADYLEKYVAHNKVKHVALAFCSILPMNLLNRIQSWAMTAEKKQTDYYVDWGSVAGYMRATHPKYFFEQTKKLPFENTYIYTSFHAVDMAEHIFKKIPWRIIPPPEKRKTHNVRLITNSQLNYVSIQEEVNG